MEGADVVYWVLFESFSMCVVRRKHEIKRTILTKIDVKYAFFSIVIIMTQAAWLGSIPAS